MLSWSECLRLGALGSLWRCWVVRLGWVMGCVPLCIVEQEGDFVKKACHEML